MLLKDSISDNFVGLRFDLFLFIENWFSSTGILKDPSDDIPVLVSSTKAKFLSSEFRICKHSSKPLNFLDNF